MEVCSEGSAPSGDRRQPSGNCSAGEGGTDKGESERMRVHLSGCAGVSKAVCVTYWCHKAMGRAKEVIFLMRIFDLIPHGC